MLGIDLRIAKFIYKLVMMDADLGNNGMEDIGYPAGSGLKLFG